MAPELVTDEQLLEMARHRYGYGRWDAPFWFLGPEEGMDKGGIGTMERKAAEWLRWGSPEVCDCREFHHRIGVTMHHEDEPGPPLEDTWRPLMLFLLTLNGALSDEQTKEADLKQLRQYQRVHWGSAKGETCVIELSAFPAKSFAFPVAEKFKKMHTGLLEERIAFLQGKIQENKPRVVVMYSLREQKSWEKIAGGTFHRFKIQGKRAEIRKSDSVVYVLTPQPAGAFGMPNAYWVELAKKLRAEYPELVQK